MTQTEFHDWKQEASRMAAQAIHAKIETEKADDLAERSMIGRAIADKLWTSFERIVDERAPHAVEAVLTKLASMTLNELVDMLHNIKG